MNERIKQLCQQKADYWMNHYDRKSLADMSLLYNDVEKFAELIVRECIKSLWTEECHTSDLAVEEYNRNSKKIKQHFGVE